MDKSILRYITYVLMLVLVFSIVPGIGVVQAAAGDVEIAMVTDGMDPQTYNGYALYYDAIWKGIREYAIDNEMPRSAYAAYYSESTSVNDQSDMIKEAISDGADVIVLAIYNWGKSILNLIKANPDVLFIVFGSPAAKEYPSNTVSVGFDDVITGFLAGYAAVMEGYTSLGFAGATKESNTYGYGFIQGADYAATELGVPVTMKYWLIGSHEWKDYALRRFLKWDSQGVELVLITSFANTYRGNDAAQESSLAIMGYDVDMGAIFPSAINSAMRYYDNVVKQMLEQRNQNYNVWPSYLAGKTFNMSFMDNAAGLATNSGSWRFAVFSLDDYEQIASEIGQGTVSINHDTSKKPKTETVKVTYEE